MNSQSSDVPLVNPSPEFPDPSTLSPQDRQLRLSGFHKRAAAGEELSVFELRYTIDLIRCDRAGAQRERKKAKVEGKKQVVAPTLDDLMA
jgi:hypothetical protein